MSVDGRYDVATLAGSFSWCTEFTSLNCDEYYADDVSHVRHACVWTDLGCRMSNLPACRKDSLAPVWDVNPRAVATPKPKGSSSTTLWLVFGAAVLLTALAAVVRRFLRQGGLASQSSSAASRAIRKEELASLAGADADADADDADEETGLRESLHGGAERELTSAEAAAELEAACAAARVLLDHQPGLCGVESGQGEGDGGEGGRKEVEEEMGESGQGEGGGGEGGGGEGRRTDVEEEMGESGQGGGARRRGGSDHEETQHDDDDLELPAKYRPRPSAQSLVASLD
jgi:hypothetical protein